MKKDNHATGEAGISLAEFIYKDVLHDAEYSVGLLQGFIESIESIELCLPILRMREAVFSSRLAGIESTPEKVFLYIAGAAPEDMETIAVRNLFEILSEEIALSELWIKGAHTRLHNKLNCEGIPGEYRESKTPTARDPEGKEKKPMMYDIKRKDLPRIVKGLFKGIKLSKETQLLNAAFAHHQFEMIHPFNDGNGRIGRAMIPKLLEELLPTQILFLSPYFSKHYYDYIDSIRRADRPLTAPFREPNIEHWLKFFLEAVVEESENTKKIIKQILKLRDTIEDKYKDVRSPSLEPLIEYMFKHPAFSFKDVTDDLKSTRPTMSLLIERFIEDGYLIPHIGADRKSKIYLFQSLINIIDTSDVRAYGANVRGYNEYAQSIIDWPKEEEEYLQSLTVKQRSEMTDYEFAKNVKMNFLAKLALEHYFETECKKSKHKMKMCMECRKVW